MAELVTDRVWLTQTDSTMREARERSGAKDFMLVSAEFQTQGRGTQGRTWLTEQGNIFMTIAMRRSLVAADQVGLLPLNTGILLHTVYTRYLDPEHRAHCHIKWPNDILIGSRKVSGVLIESDLDHFFVGIGINVAVAPHVTDGGRHSGCLASYASQLPTNRDLMQEIFDGAMDFCLRPAPAEQVVAAASARMDWRQSIRLRSQPDKEWTALRLSESGALVLRDADLREITITSEYLE